MSTTVPVTAVPLGTSIWLPDKASVWKCVELACDYESGGKALEYIEEGLRKSYELKGELFLKNPEILIGQNDLTSLSYLHEPAVLFNLKTRFGLNCIYTYCGIVLVAINPYEELDIYNQETIQAYRGMNWGDLDPHIFAVAEEAYTKMERDGGNQSIIVSGESGAGKTVSAKYAMRYFATVGGSENETKIERKVLASSPIMEAIGNAKTTRNDNSSRFGKYVELNFNLKYSITSASMRTYLLEKSRVVYQSEEERNYHIFYQICAAAQTHPELSELFLEEYSKFFYTKQGGDGGNKEMDAKNFAETVEALTLLGFGVEDRRNFFKIVAAILQLGNFTFTKSQGAQEGAVLQKDSPSLLKLVSLLQVDGDLLRKCMVTRRIKSGREEILKELTVQESIYSRDALAKYLYSELFNWIVAGINNALLKYDKVVHKFIGVLDIYGFETFEFNSFEQFCINYANEKLQQQFNQHVFKLEQEEYIREGIDWKFIDFFDNQKCIDLIESKLGILDLLDEECRMPNGSDGSWILKLHSKCGGSKHYLQPKIGGETNFVVKHFADQVTYTCNGFIEKNRDSLMGELLSVVGSSKNLFVSELYGVKTKPAPGPGRVGGSAAPSSEKKRTVGSSFVESLKLLMSSLNLTTPHYVRCIKPNDLKLPFVFDADRAVQQLRACGVLETVRISAAGFPSRWTYQDFHNRYRMLQQRDKHGIGGGGGELQGKCKSLVEKLIRDEDQYRFGKSKLFFRAGQVAFLEKVRLVKLQKAGLVVQKLVKGWAKRCVFLKVRRSIGLLQCHGRGWLGRKRAQLMRETRAAVTVQRYVRGWACRRRYGIMRNVVLQMQCIGRGWLARRRARILRETRAAVVIQRTVRGWTARVRYGKQRKKIVLAQSVVRRYLARRKFKSLKLEARSLQHVKMLNKGLENKIIELQQKIDAFHKENQGVNKLKQEIETLKGQQTVGKIAEKELVALKREFSSVEMAKVEIEKLLEKERQGNFDILNEKNILQEKVQAEEKIVRSLTLEVGELREELKDLKEEGVRMEEFKIRAGLLERELEEERGKYQALVGKSFANADLQQKAPVPLPRSLGVTSAAESPSIILKLQKQLKLSDELRLRLEEKLESVGGGGIEGLKYTQDQIRLQELEMDNSKLKTELDKLRSAGDVSGEIQKQFAQLSQELARKKEEAIQLRTVLAFGPRGGDGGRGGDNLDEIDIVVDTQKKIITELERALSQATNEKSSLLARYEAELLLGESSSDEVNDPPLSREISRLASENVNLRELNLKLQEELRQRQPISSSQQNTITANNRTEDEGLSLQIHRKQRNYMGMLEYKCEDQTKIIRAIILDLQPAVAIATNIQGLPAFIIFMLIRYTDYLNDDDRVRSLLTTAVSNIKKVVRKKGDSMDVVILWLTNILRLLHTLKQYSGDAAFQLDNTQKQNEQALKNFDLSEYRQVLSDHAVWVYMLLIKNLEDGIQSLIVPAILENAGIDVVQQSHQKITSNSEPKPLETLIRQLDQTFNLLTSYGLDIEVIHQIFKQIFYYICAGALNNLLLRRELCHWGKGIEIRYNLSTLEEWCRGKGMDEVKETLSPVVQASQILQARKSDKDDATLCDICDKLSVQQVVKLLNLYSSKDGLDTDKVSKLLIEKVQQRLTEQRQPPHTITENNQQKSSLLMDTKFSFAVKFPFNPSNVLLEDITIPDNYAINHLVKRL